MDPGQEFLVIHLDLVRASEGLADRVLDGPDDSLHRPNSSVVLGEGDPEFNRGKLDVEGGDTFILVSIKSLPALTMLSPESIQIMRGVPLSAKVRLNPLVMPWELYLWRISRWTARLERQSTTRTHL